jgi:hypothetical protein
MNYPGLAGRDARLAEMLTLLLKRGGHVLTPPDSVDDLLEAAERAIAPPAAQPAAPASDKWAPENLARAEWASIHRALTQARDYLCKDGARHTWLDGDIALAGERAKEQRRYLPSVEPVTKGWLDSLSSAFHQARQRGNDHDAEKLREILHHFARADRPPVAFPPEVSEALGTMSRALDMLAAGEDFNQVVEKTGVTRAVSLARVSAQAAVEEAANTPPPVVVVTVDAGMVKAVDASRPADVVVLDADIYGCDITDLTAVGDGLFRVTEQAANVRANVPGAGAAFVSDVIARLDEAEAVRIAAMDAEEEAENAGPRP